MPGYERVHCDLPNVGVNGYGGAIAKTVAINRDQWGGSAACGMCIEVEGTYVFEVRVTTASSRHFGSFCN